MLWAAVAIEFVLIVALAMWINFIVHRSNELAERVMRLEARPKQPPKLDPVKNFQVL